MRNPFQSLIQNQVAAFQTQLVEALEELSRMELEGSSGGGAVKVLMTGGGEVRRVTIEPSVLETADKELIEDLITAAMRDALARVSQTKREKIVSSTPLAGMGVDLPDIF
jgi:DNA-binding YbaB/EbfC family protein